MCRDFVAGFLCDCRLVGRDFICRVAGPRDFLEGPHGYFTLIDPDGERVLPGHAYIAPGGMHLRVEKSGANYLARVTDGDPVNRHKPSVEVLFKSAATVVGRNAVSIMLTGMGADGAKAMREMRDAGAYCIAQDEHTCVVFGMPREAIAAGAVHEVLPLNQIASHMLDHLRSTAGPALSRV